MVVDFVVFVDFDGDGDGDDYEVAVDDWAARPPTAIPETPLGFLSAQTLATMVLAGSSSLRLERGTA